MSLHIDITDEAKQELEKRKKRETLSSIGITLLAMAGLGLGFWAMKVAFEDMSRPEMISYNPPTGAGDEPTQKEVVRPSTTSSSAAPRATRVIASTAPSSISITPPDIVVTDPTMGMSQGLEMGTGFGGLGSGGGGGGIPGTMNKRCSPEDRLKRLKEMGGTEQCETAVQNGLKWLKGDQNPDGSWGGTNGTDYPVAMTALTLLAYFGHCETPLSEEFGESCMKGITYLVNVAKKNEGKMASNFNDKHWCYEHSIATYAISEAYTFCNTLGIPIAKEMGPLVQKAAQYIVDNQCPTGGWEYSYNASDARGGDLSISGWHVQALKAASHTGLKIDNLDKSLKSAGKYVTSCFYEVSGGLGGSKKDAGKGSFAYTSGTRYAPGGQYALCGTGILSLQMVGEGNSREARAGLKSIEEDIKFDFGGPQTGDLYMHYYMAQATLNRGGESWTKYNPGMRDQLLANQEQNGLFKAPSKPVQGIHRFAGQGKTDKVYRNALCCLMLEVYYRFLPGTGHTK